MTSKARIEDILERIRTIARRRKLTGKHEGHCTFGVEYDEILGKQRVGYFATIDIGGQHKYWVEDSMDKAMNRVMEFLGDI